MKYYFLLPVVWLFSILGIAQSANLDREKVQVSYVKLPSHPILEKENRTYSSNSSALTISGYKRQSEEAVLTVDFDYHGTQVEDVNINKEKHEKKDKEGNVTSTTYTYAATANYTSTGTLIINNSVSGGSKTQNYSEKKAYKSSDYSTYNKARDYYNNNKDNLRNKQNASHKSIIVNNAKAYLNATFGFVPTINKYEFFWILGSKKHPEFENHHINFDKLKVIIDNMKYDQPIDELEKELEPVITYFENVVEKYQGKKKKLRKVRYASYYNLANIYYYLDQPEKCEAYGQKIIDNDYDKSDGRYFIRIAKNLKQKLESNKVDSRHFSVDYMAE
ncbi:hypothetical protein [Olleya sp. HaHaR_3_96]|uniref:hypothetical protein n=1 Tax=Olleya sp. HaHaR_3_96 TaxID=2745560 RepID=UPI001C4E91E9|nr:hypothetical protein [Olleya sp. HaHaR_3_96]QXP61167.1 hypothetical protein H0I26_05925 [Olleya sp. HaHaR_3_96]